MLVYACSEDDLPKQQRAVSITGASECCISTQVLTEFVNVFHCKLRVPWADVQVTLFETASGFRIHENSAVTITQATRLADRYGFSWFDSLILAALECGFETLYSEDSHHDQLLENSLRIINPFRP